VPEYFVIDWSLHLEGELSGSFAAQVIVQTLRALQMCLEVA